MAFRTFTSSWWRPWWLQSVYFFMIASMMAQEHSLHHDKVQDGFSKSGWCPWWLSEHSLHLDDVHDGFSKSEWCPWWPQNIYFIKMTSMIMMASTSLDDVHDGSRTFTSMIRSGNFDPKETDCFLTQERRAKVRRFWLDAAFLTRSGIKRRSLIEITNRQDGTRMVLPKIFKLRWQNRGGSRLFPESACFQNLGD